MNRRIWRQPRFPAPRRAGSDDLATVGRLDFEHPAGSAFKVQIRPAGLQPVFDLSSARPDSAANSISFILCFTIQLFAIVSDASFHPACRLRAQGRHPPRHDPPPVRRQHRYSATRPPRNRRPNLVPTPESTSTAPAGDLNTGHGNPPNDRLQSEKWRAARRNVALADIAARFGNPLLRLFTFAALEAALDEFHNELNGVDALVCYAVGPNSNLGIPEPVRPPRRWLRHRFRR